MVNRKELHPEKGPADRYGDRLRRLREAQGWTQEDLAERMGCSSQHISAVETARKPPTPRFSRKADVVFGTAETAESFERESQQIKHGVLLEGFPEYVAHEGRAVEIRLYELGIIPGLLQTPAYTRVLADRAVQRGSSTPEQADERVRFLAERQSALTRSRPPTVLVVMDESCIRRQVGGPAVMAAQLDHLADFAALPNTTLQVATYAIGEHRPFNLPVNLLTLPDWSVIAYAESQMQGHLDREPTAVMPLLRAYHQLQAAAASQAETVAMIRELRKGTS
ncbi:Scr1 family TA system antitoxin-like transcriptional regulator [Streptomyces sp. NPDC051546]|uniref:helix-turn-helix domain-containing protein n=1 Tax=Streptomyces sp. NPDC051546 TaxID=3365655 RepID=UPI0037920D3A